MQYLAKFIRRVVAKPWVYDHIQMLFGLKQTQQRLIHYLAQTHQKIVLDVGAGTGLYQSLLPETAQYIWLDVDSNKLEGFKCKQTLHMAVLGDATRLCIQDKSVDFAICIGLSHHLSDQQLKCLFIELARGVREKMIFLDALDFPDSLVSRLLWKYDRGSYPRNSGDIISEIEAQFEIEKIDMYKIYHHYFLCVARPKNR